MGACDRYDTAFWISTMKRNLDATTMTELESHCASCEQCREEFDFYDKLSRIVELETLEPPEAWTSEAAARFDSTATLHEQSIVADLVFDSLLAEADAVRSRRLETRHLVFDVAGFEIDLVLEYSGPRLDMVMGHVMTKDHRERTNGRVGLELRAEARVYSTLSNELGEFTFKLGTRMGGDPLELRCKFQEGPCAIVLIPC